MFSELPKLIDRNYAIAYATPSAIFLVLVLKLLEHAGFIDLTQLYTSQLNADPLIGTAALVFVAWLFGLVLSAVNQSIVRFLGGYGGWKNPLSIFKGNELREFRRLKDAINTLTQQVNAIQEAANQAPLSPKQDPLTNEQKQQLKVSFGRLDILRWERSYYFPYDRDHDEELIMPTRLGNIIRSFEVYPRIMYGIDGVSGWNRLIFVIPKDAREIITSAKSYFDLWINGLILGSIFLIIYLLLWLTNEIQLSLLAILVNVGVILICHVRGQSAAIVWGDTVRAAFDVYLPSLGDALKYDVAPYRTYEFWTDFSVGVVYKAYHRLAYYKRILASEKEEQIERQETFYSPTDVDKR